MRTIALFLAVLFMVLAFPPGMASAPDAPSPKAAPTVQDEAEWPTVVRVYYNQVEDIKLLVNFDLFEFHDPQEKYVLVAADTADMESLEALRFRVEVDQEQNASFNAYGLPVGGELAANPAYACYRTVEGTYQAAREIAQHYPSLASWIDIGDSWKKLSGSPEGSDIMVLKLTNAAIPGDKPRLFVTGGIHPRELATTELVTRFAEYLVQNYGIDADVTWILDHHEVHLLLLANPDGHRQVENGAYWRKNTNENICAAASKDRGADLNRNFDFQWDCCGGSSDSPCDPTYRGTAPASEPEVQAIQNYMASIFPDQRGPGLDAPAPADSTGIFLDIHAYGREVLWAWGFTSKPAPNDTALRTLARKFAFFNGYSPQQSIGYSMDGASDDYAYGVLGVAGYTWELGTSFFQECSYFKDSILPENLPALLYAAKAARAPYLTPSGPDVFNLALEADLVPSGAAPMLTAIVSDTRYNNNSGAEPVQTVEMVEYTIDDPPWVAGAKVYQLLPADGRFDTHTEVVAAEVDISGLKDGRHILFVRGRDSGGNWGAVSALFLVVEGTPNGLPSAVHQSVSTYEDTPVAVTLAGSDPEGAPLSFRVTGAPAHGTLSGAAPALSYLPAPDYYGMDQVTFVVNDGIHDSPQATVTLVVDPVNDPPRALPRPDMVTSEDTPVVITLAGSDVEGGPLTFRVQAQPVHGSLAGTAPDLTYTPHADFNGQDRFSFIVNDGAADSQPETVAITVMPANDPPVAYPAQVSAVRDQDIAVSLAGADIDGDPLLYTLVAEPDHGAMSGTPPHLVYTPHPGYTGPDSFTFKVNDTQLDSNEAVVSITVNSPTPLSVFLDDFRYVLLETGKYLQNLFSSTAFLDFIKMFSARLDLAACGA